MRPSTRRWARCASALASIPLALSSCGTTEVCDLLPHTGLTVEVRDAGSGAPAAEGAAVHAAQGSFQETLTRVGDLSFHGLVERPGTYAVTVAKAGYALFDTNGVVVRQGDCHVETTTIAVELGPE